MAKIIHVANFSPKTKGSSFFHAPAVKLTNGLIRNGHAVVTFSDRDVARASSLLGHRKFGIRGANDKLRDLCREVQPHLLLLGHADVIRPDNIADIRRELPAIRVLQWNVDAGFEPDNIRRISSKLEVVDATLVTTAGKALQPLWRKDKLLGFMPNAVDYSIESGRAHEHADLPYDLLYGFGNPWLARFVAGKDYPMENLLQIIEQGVPGLRLRIAGMRGFPYLRSAAYEEALATSACGISIGRRNDVYLYASDRLAHMCGNGMAILIDRATGYGDFFSDKEFSFFATAGELIENLRKLIADKPYRQALAAAGRARYHALFNEQIVARYIMEVAFGTLRESDYIWPTLFKGGAA